MTHTKGATLLPRKPWSQTAALIPAGLESALLSHLGTYHSVDNTLLGPSRALDFVRLAIERALAQKFVRSDEIHRYLDLMVVFGSGFARDPQLPWAARSLLDPKRTMKSLWNEALSYIGEVAGPKGGRYIKALYRAEKLSSSYLCDSCFTSSEQSAELLAGVHPEKRRTMSGEIESLFALALKLTRKYSPNAKGVRPIYLLLMFLLGSEFERDPRYAWAPEILGDPLVLDAQKHRRLHEAALATLKQALSLLKRTGALPDEG